MEVSHHTWKTVILTGKNCW